MEPLPQGRDGALFEKCVCKTGQRRIQNGGQFPQGHREWAKLIAGSGLPSLSFSTVPLQGPVLFIQRSHGPPGKEVGETPLSYRCISLLKALGSPPGLFFFLASPGRWVSIPLSSGHWSPFTNLVVTHSLSLSLVCPPCSPWLLRYLVQHLQQYTGFFHFPHRPTGPPWVLRRHLLPLRFSGTLMCLET